MRRTRLLLLLTLMACFGLPSLADEPPASESSLAPGAGFEESLEKLRDQFNHKMGELTERKLEELEARENERQMLQLEQGYALRAGRPIEVIVVRPSRSRSGDALEAVANRAP